MRGVILRSNKGFPKTILHKDRTWFKVKNEKHRDDLEDSNEYDFAQCFDDSIRFGFSYHLYYSLKVFEFTKVDKQIISELDEMLEHFMSLKPTSKDVENAFKRLDKVFMYEEERERSRLLIENLKLLEGAIEKAMSDLGTSSFAHLTLRTALAKYKDNL